MGMTISERLGSRVIGSVQSVSSQDFGDKKRSWERYATGGGLVSQSLDTSGHVWRNTRKIETRLVGYDDMTMILPYLNDFLHQGKWLSDSGMNCPSLVNWCEVSILYMLLLYSPSSVFTDSLAWFLNSHCVWGKRARWLAGSRCESMWHRLSRSLKLYHQTDYQSRSLRIFTQPYRSSEYIRIKHNEQYPPNIIYHNNVQLWSKEVWKSKVPCYGCLHLKSMTATAKDS